MKAIICDCDGTLINTEPHMQKASKLTFKEFGVKLSKTQILRYVGRGARGVVEGLAKECNLQNIDEMIEIRQEHFYDLAKKKGLGIYPHVREFLKEAKQHSKLALATSAKTKKLNFALKLAGINKKSFKLIINGDHITHFKPHPEIFKITVKKLGLKPKDCVVIEDSISGVTAAKKAGCYCIAVTNTTPASKLQHADLVVRSLKSKAIWKFIDSH